VCVCAHVNTCVCVHACVHVLIGVSTADIVDRTWRSNTE